MNHALYKTEYQTKVQRQENIRDSYQQLIATKEKEAERLQEEAAHLKQALHNLPHVSWADELVRPIAEYFKEKLGGKYEISGPFGLRSTVIVYWYKEEKPLHKQSFYYLTIVPGNLSEGELLYETGNIRTDHAYPKGSIGYVNGMHKETKPLPEEFKDIEALIQYEAQEEKA